MVMQMEMTIQNKKILQSSAWTGGRKLGGGVSSRKSCYTLEVPGQTNLISDDSLAGKA
jgi:hypothetical protein